MPVNRRCSQIVIYIIGIIFFLGCHTQHEKKIQISEPPVKQDINRYLPYDLSAPDRQVFLPNILTEISGLTYVNNEQLMCVQDEKGIIYTLDASTGEIMDEIKFGKDGDFEGIEKVGEYVYTIRSDGTLFKTSLANNVTQVYKTPLSIQNDVEGLGYDSLNTRLLIACKEQAGIHTPIPDSRAIYAFDLQTHTLNENPVIVLNKTDIEPFLIARSRKKQSVDFKPSGVAVHPLSGHIYIIAAHGKMLLIVNAQGNLLHVEFLSPKNYRKPEGICFAPNGDMYISNEGQKGKATILQFKYRSPD